jgi:hypothetical protein
VTVTIQDINLHYTSPRTSHTSLKRQSFLRNVLVAEGNDGISRLKLYPALTIVGFFVWGDFFGGVGV